MKTKSPIIFKFLRWPGLLAGLTLGLACCSEQTNPLAYLSKPWSDKDAAAFLSRSQILLDAGDYEGALVAAEKAFSLAPLQARMATQLSYAHLAVAGLDLFQLARKMIDKETNKDAPAATDPPAGTSEPAPAEALNLLADESAAGQLASLADLVGLSESDYEAITLPGNKLGDLEGAPSSGPFAALPILLPKTAIDARESGSPTLEHIASAITVLCNFLPEEVKLLGDDGDIRHTSESCEPGARRPTQEGKAKFVWAIAHLIEAVAFHQVVLYQPSGTTPQLLQRSQVLSTYSQSASITAYVKAVTELASVVDVVMPVDPALTRTSMLTAMFNDLETVSRTFTQMPNIPEKLAGGIVRSLDQLKGQKEKLGQKPGVDGNSTVLKDQLTSGLATELKKQIEGKEAEGQLSPKEKADVCEAYQSISSEGLSLCTAI